MADIIRTADVSERQLLQWMRQLVVTSEGSASSRDAVLEAIWNYGDHRLPCEPVGWTFYPHRLIVKPLIYNGRARHELIQEMLCSPGRVYLVSDAQEPGPHSLTLCVAGFSISETERWLGLMRPAKMILGEFQGTRLLSAPLISFTQL